MKRFSYLMLFFALPLIAEWQYPCQLKNQFETPNAQEGWVRWFGTTGWDFSKCVQQTSDGNYIVICTYNGQEYWGEGEFLLIKLDAMGDTLWTHTYGPSTANFVIETSDKGYALCGEGLGAKDVIIKTDSLGNREWTFEYDEDWGYNGLCLVETSDSCYVLSGLGRLLKVDSSGGLIWSRFCQYLFCNSVQETSEGGLIIAAMQRINASNTMCLFKTNSSGHTVWTQLYPTAIYNQDRGLWAEEISSGGYIVGGGRRSLMRTDELGQALWFQEGYNYYTYCVRETRTGHFVSTGFTEEANIRLLKSAEDGDTVWCRVFEAPDGDIGFFVTQTDDGGYIIAGKTKSFGFGRDDIIVIKTDSLGLMPPQVSPSKPVRPAPAGDYLTMNPKGQFTNFGTDESITDFYCHCEITDLNDTTSLYQDSVFVTESLGPWESREIEFSEWTAHAVSNYQARFYATEAGNGQDMAVDFRWTGISEQPTTQQPAFEVVTAVGNFVLLSSQSEERSQLAIFDASGRLVDEVVINGPSTIMWGNGFSPGVYFFRDAQGSQTQKAVLLK